MYMLGYTVISITEVSMYILMIIIQTENTLLMGSPKDLYWGLCCSLFTLMTSPEPQIYCFQYYLLMTKAFSLKAQTITKLLIF